MRMKTNITVSLHVWRRRALGVVGALMLAGSVLALTASAASADMACHYPPGSNTCLTIEPVPSGWYAIKLGIDINYLYSPAYLYFSAALDLIAAAQAAGQPVFNVQIWGEDGSYDDRQFDLRDCSATAYPGALYGECYAEVPPSALNEDTEGRDELYAQVRLIDCRSGPCVRRHYWRSGVVYWP
jgi:hypothetical protein